MAAVKKPVVNADLFVETREIVNGHGVKDNVVSYDGKTLQNEDKQLKTLLMRPMSKMNLLERLYGDCMHKRTHKRNKKRKRINKTKRHT